MGLCIELLTDAGVELIPIENLHLYGRIVFFDINSIVCDGAPAVESNYYVDINDTPVDT